MLDCFFKENNMFFSIKKNEYKIINQLLKNTARTFYLTIKALPYALRLPISLAYLLARTSDTIADEANISADAKRHLLKLIKNKINNTHQANNDIFNQLNSLQLKNENELILISYFTQIINWLYSIDNADRQNIQTVLTTIINGQIIDVECFQDKTKINCLVSVEALENYIYSVAGCVGEFWTAISLLHIKNYSTLSPELLHTKGVSFGKGLQLVNILRDLPNDLHKGRCYFPLEQLRSHNITPDLLAKNIHLLDPFIDYWWQKAIYYLHEGWVYMLSISNRRIRATLVLPLILGFATLHQLKNKNYLDSAKIVKVSRSQIKNYLLIAFLSIFSRSFLKLLNKTSFGYLIPKDK